MTTETTVRYVALGTTDEITSCEVCPKVDLTHTVHLALVDEDGETVGELYVGSDCAARMSGRKAKDIRTEAARADRARDTAVRDAHRVWQNAHGWWRQNTVDAAIGRWHTPAQFRAYTEAAGFVEADAAWLAEHPEPPRPW